MYVLVNLYMIKDNFKILYQYFINIYNEKKMNLIIKYDLKIINKCIIYVYVCFGYYMCL